MVGYAERNKGFEVEGFVMDFFHQKGFEVSKIDSFYDIEVSKGAKKELIEIKSCNLYNKDTLGSRRIGRFDFTNIDNLKKQKNNNVKVCFVLIMGSELEILGLLRARSLEYRRYFTLLDIFSRRTMTPERFISKFTTSYNTSQ